MQIFRIAALHLNVKAFGMREGQLTSACLVLEVCRRRRWGVCELDIADQKPQNICVPLPDLQTYRSSNWVLHNQTEGKQSAHMFERANVY